MSYLLLQIYYYKWEGWGEEEGGDWKISSCDKINRDQHKTVMILVLPFFFYPQGVILIYDSEAGGGGCHKNDSALKAFHHPLLKRLRTVLFVLSKITLFTVR